MIHQPQGELQLLSCSSPKTHEWYFFQPEKYQAWQDTKADITFADRSSVYGMICLESWSSYPSIDTSIVYVFTWLDIVCFQFMWDSHLVGQIGCHVTSHRPAFLLWYKKMTNYDTRTPTRPNLDRVVDCVVAVEVITVLREHLREDNVPLVPGERFINKQRICWILSPDASMEQNMYTQAWHWEPRI